MDYRALRDTVRDPPSSELLDALDEGAARINILTLLDLEMQRSAFRLQRLGEHRNSLSSPIYRLFPEILSHIFFVYAEDNKELYNMRWARLLLVCRRWYDVAIHTPKLWSFIEIRLGSLPSVAFHTNADDKNAQDVKGIEAQQNRAGHWPLTISMDLGGAHRELGVKEVYLSMFWDPRFLLSLAIDGPPKHIVQVLHALASRQHTSLNSLAVESFHYNNSASTISLTHSYFNDALKDKVPALQALRVGGIYDHRTDPVLPPLCDIVTALSRSPLLEELVLRLPAAFSPTTATSRASTTLSCISTIHLIAAADVCIQLMQAFAEAGVPGTARMCISALAPRGIDAFMEARSRSLERQPSFPLVTLLGQHASKDSAPKIRAVVVSLSAAMLQSGPDPQLGVVGLHRPDRRVAGVMRSQFCMNKMLPHEYPYIAFETPMSDSPTGGMLAGLLRPWPLARATHLDIHHVGVLGVTHCAALFAVLSTATTIIVHLESRCARSIIDVLRARLQTGAGRGAFADIVFDTAQMERAMTSRAFAWEPSDSELARSTVMRALQYSAEVARAGAPLNTLEIVNEPETQRQNRILEPSADLDWSELYKDLSGGFVYEGTLYNADVGREGVMRDSFGEF